MANFFSSLGQGLQDFGSTREARQMDETQLRRQQQDRIRRQQELDRNYAWEVASHLAPDQDLDPATAELFTKAGPELGAYIAADPVTGARKWRGTQQQQTNEAREKATHEATQRTLADLKRREDEEKRREAVNVAVSTFTKANGRRPTRNELYSIMSEHNALDAKELTQWDQQDSIIARQEAMARRASMGPQPRQAPAAPDMDTIISEARRAYAKGALSQEEYETTINDLNRMRNVEKNPLQAYINELRDDLTNYMNKSRPVNGEPATKTYNEYRTPEAYDTYLNYIQSDPDWLSQAQGDFRSPDEIKRYYDYVKQIRDRVAQEQSQQPPSQPWYTRFFRR